MGKVQRVTPATSDNHSPRPNGNRTKNTASANTIRYVLDTNVAYANFAHFSAPVCLIGHTHVPVIFELDEQQDRCNLILSPLPDPLKLGQHRMIINPGSVGQPRDGDPRTSYAVLDTENMTLRFHRVAYPIEITQERMRARGLPRRLIDRLEMGR